MRRAATVAAGLALLLTGGPAAAFQADGGCSAVFPGTVFELRVPAGPVTVVTADLTAALAERHAADLVEVATAIDNQIGGLDGAEVCLFPDALPLDSEALGWPEGQRLRAASFVDERVVALSAQQARLVRPAAILGMAHQAQWASSGGGYPATFGSAVGQWYRSGAAGELERDHSSLRYARITGSLAEPVPWSAGSLDPIMLWAPQFQDSPIGDFVDYAVEAVGPGILADPDPAVLARLDGEWRQALLNEARGSDRPTSDWVSGLIVVVGAFVLAATIPTVAWWRRRRRRPVTGPPPESMQPRTPVGQSTDR